MSNSEVGAVSADFGQNTVIRLERKALEALSFPVGTISRHTRRILPHHVENEV